MIKTILKFLALLCCLILLTYCSKEPDAVIGSDFNFTCDSPQTICARPDSIGKAFAMMDCDGGGISNVLECRNGTDFKVGDDDCAAAVRGKIDICMLIRSNPEDSTSSYDPSHVLAQQDCDGGGLTNIEECMQGFNPLKDNDLDELNGRTDDLDIENYLKNLGYINDNMNLLDTIGTIGVLDSMEIVKTESGLVYIVEQIGLGEIPMAEDSIEFNFTSNILSGCETVSGCAKVPIQDLTNNISKVRNNIFGIQEWLSLFPAGSTGKLIIPSRIAYNDLEIDNIPSYTVIVMDIDFIRIL